MVCKLVLVQYNIFVLFRNKRFDISKSLTALGKHINLKSILQQDIFQIISFAIVMYLNVKCQKLNLLIYNLGLMFIFLSLHLSIFACFYISFAKSCGKNSLVIKTFIQINGGRQKFNLKYNEHIFHVFSFNHVFKISILIKSNKTIC